MTISSLNQVLAEVNVAFLHGLACCTYSLLDTTGLFAALGGRDGAKVPGTDPSH